MTGLAVGDGQEGKPLGQSRMPMTSGIDMRLPDTKGVTDLSIFLLVIFIGAEENARIVRGGLMRFQERLSPPLWRLFALLMLSVAINHIDRGALSTAAPLLKDELGLTTSQLGILLSSFFCTYAAFMVISGWLADHLNVNWVLATGFFVWCAATVATGFVHSFAALLAARLVLGMGESVSYPSYCTLLARHVPECRRGFANAALAIGLGIGPQWEPSRVAS